MTPASEVSRPIGDLALVLHAHLPFVRHPEHPYHLEENWLYEAITATYLPLIELLRGLPPSHVRLTLSLSPPLCSMLADPLLRERYGAHLERLVRLGDEEVAREGSEEAVRALSRYYLERFTRLRALYHDLSGDLIGAFAALQERGVLDVITTCATHGYLPVIREPAARRAQIAVAVRAYRGWFGRYPRGLWLPECGYVDGVDQLLAENDLRYFFMDAHGLTYARPRPPLGLHAPIFTPTGVAAFARDLESSRQVWSATEGYPADGVYRDFYRDIGFDRPLDVISPYIHPDGIRVHTGYKYHRITGQRVDLSQKELYDPAAASLRARAHAHDFVEKRRKQLTWLSQRMDRRPILVSPYDAELFGHWWFEGPEFLRAVLEELSQEGSAIKLNTASGYLADYPVNAVCEPAPSSWGEGGYSAVWLDSANDWIYRHVHRAEAQLRALATQHGSAKIDDGLRRALNQMARELLLSQSSDWAFIMKTGTAVSYAEARVKSHLGRFQALLRQVQTNTLDLAGLAEIEAQDNIFPDIDFRVYAF